MYVGISRNIAQRQKGHNAGKPGTQGNRKMKKALAGRAASQVVTAKRLVSFGKTNLSEIPQPILHCIETAIIGCARLTSSPISIQVNIVDTPPFLPSQRPVTRGMEVKKGELLARVWKKMWEYWEEQKADFALGRFMRYGCRPVPIGLDGE